MDTAVTRRPRTLLGGILRVLLFLLVAAVVLFLVLAVLVLNPTTRNWISERAAGGSAEATTGDGAASASTAEQTTIDIDAVFEDLGSSALTYRSNASQSDFPLEREMASLTAAGDGGRARAVQAKYLSNRQRMNEAEDIASAAVGDLAAALAADPGVVQEAAEAYAAQSPDAGVKAMVAKIVAIPATASTIEADALAAWIAAADFRTER